MTSTTRAASRQQAGAVPEPALRPAGAAFPDRYVTRRARVYVDRGAAGTAIVIRDPRGRERRIPAVPGGVTGLVLERMAGAFQGTLTLAGDRGQVLARLPLPYWGGGWTMALLAPDGTPADLAALDIAAFAAATGLPLTDNRREAEAPDDRGPGAGGGAERQRRWVRIRRDHRAEPPGTVTFRSAVIPAWYQAVRVLVGLLWLGLVILVFSDTAYFLHPNVVIAAAAAVLAPSLLLAGAILFAREWWLDRATGRPLRAADATLAPRPRRPVPRRFLRTASLRLLPAELVVTSDDGAEQWLPRQGPTAVAGLAKVTVHGRPDRVELRTADGTPRAVLPWELWFAGRGGEQALDAFAAAAGLPVTATEGKRLPRDEVTRSVYNSPAPDPVVGDLTPWRGLPPLHDSYAASSSGFMSALFALISQHLAVLFLGLAVMAVSLAARFVLRRVLRWQNQVVEPGEAA